MSIFSKILDKLGLGKKKEEEDAEQAKVLEEMARKEAEARAKMAKDAAARAPGAPVPTPVGSVPKAPAAPAKTTAPGVAQPAAAATKPMSKVDVVTKLENLAQGSGLNWKSSIADLLALLKIDHSREARIELAKELGCPPEYITGDLSKMNTWLHKTVLQKIADNGGNIPQELLD